MVETLKGAEALGPRVCAVNVMPEYRLQLSFTNGETRIYDAAPLLEWPAYRALKDVDFFNAARVAFGTVCWPDDIDCCPDRLYRDSVPVDAALMN